MAAGPGIRWRMAVWENFVLSDNFFDFRAWWPLCTQKPVDCGLGILLLKGAKEGHMASSGKERQSFSATVVG